MSSPIRTAAAVALCPHGGAATAITAHRRVAAASGPVMTAADSFVIVGCPAASPCVKAVCHDTWARVKVSGSALGKSWTCLDAADQSQGALQFVADQTRVAAE